MTPEVVTHIEERYIELYENITGQKFERRDYTADIIGRNVVDYLKGLR